MTKRAILCLTAAFLLLAAAGCQQTGAPADATPSALQSGEVLPSDSPSDSPSASASPSPAPSADEYVYGDSPVEERYASDTIKTGDGITLVTYEAAVPQLKGTGGAAAVINDYYEQELENFLYVAETEMAEVAKINLESSETGEGEFMSCYAKQNYDVQYADENLLSISRSMEFYYGTVNVDVNMKTETFDLKTGALITLDNLFAVGQTTYIRRLADEVSAQIVLDGGVQAGYYENYAERASEYLAPENFYLTKDGLVVFYPTITVAPLMSGICKFEIGFDKLSDILSEQWPVNTAE